MKNRLQPEATIFQIIYDVTGNSVNDIRPEQKLVDDLGMDSLDIITVGNEMEKKFEIVIFDVEYESLKTVQDLIQLALIKLNPVA